jgi:mannose-6-phosphate isomerase-like protein (cupin superfamily)
MLMKCITLGAILLVAAAPLAAQTAGAPPAPKDKAVDLPLATLEAVAKDITARGLITQRVLEGGTFSINVRHISGAETALQHGRITEVWVVRDGSGIVATGGTLVNPKPGSAAGELSGSGITGGVEREIKAGDLVFIPPGVPHGIKQSKFITYLNMRFEAREAKE